MVYERRSVLCLVFLTTTMLCSGFYYSGIDTKAYQDSSGKGGYLFAFMTTEEYGRLHYSISRDGNSWKLLNSGKKIINDYRGHPDIRKGGDDNYYMIGVESGLPVLWRSDSLIVWNKVKYLPSTVFMDSTPGYQPTVAYYGAPKIFYDEASDQYMITWHATETSIEGGTESHEWWEGMRTFYVLTPDFTTFTRARRLFDFQEEADREMATIDVIIRKSEGTYYAVMKDERWPDKSSTGKTIRISTSENLTGPYSDPGPPVTPSWYEAPSIVPKLDLPGWYLYAENYPFSYKLFEADSISGSWSPVDCNMEKMRHGCIVRINEEQFNRIESTYYNALPTVEIRTPQNQTVLYASAGNIVELITSDEDGTIASADLYVDGVWIPEMEQVPNTYNIDYLEVGGHTIEAEVVDDRGGMAKDSITVIIADSLVTIGEWILYQRNGALAMLSVEQETVRIEVEWVSGDLSDVMLLRDVTLPDLKSSSSNKVSFKAAADKYAVLELAIKDDPYLENALISKSFYITPFFDSYILSGVPYSESVNFFAFHLGYRNETTFYITDLDHGFLNSNRTGLMDHRAAVYPNPVSDVLCFSSKTDYGIYTLYGNLMLHGTNAEKSDLSALPGGLYIVKTEYGNFKIAKSY